MLNVIIVFFTAGIVVGAFLTMGIVHDMNSRKPKTSTITPVFAKSELQMNVVRTAIQRDRLMLEDSDQVYEYAAKKLLRQIASIIKEQLMDNIEVKNDEPTNCMILEFTFWTRRNPRKKVRNKE